MFIKILNNKNKNCWVKSKILRMTEIISKIYLNKHKKNIKITKINKVNYNNQINSLNKKKKRK